MAFMEFGVNSKKHWYFLLGSLTLILRTYLIKGGDPKLKLLYMGAGMTPSLLLELISQKCLSRSKKVRHKKQTCLQFFQLLGIYIIIAFLDSSGFVFSINGKSQENEKFHGKEHIQYMVQFIVAAILSYIFLKKRLHRHHLVFSIMMAIGMVFIILSNILSDDSEFKVHMLFLLIDGFAYGIILVIARWLMEFKFISAFEIVGYDGLFSAIIAIIIILIEGCGDASTNDTSYNPFANCDFDPLYAFPFAVLTFGYALFIFLVVQHFGETHRVVMDLLSYFIMLVINVAFKAMGEIKINVWEGFVLFFGYFVVLIGVIGYNEILVFSCFNLNYNAAIEIDRRCNELPKLDLSSEIYDKSNENDEIDLEHYLPKTKDNENIP